MNWIQQKSYTISYFVNPKSSNYDCSEESVIITAENYLQHLETSKHTLWTLLDVKQKKLNQKFDSWKRFRSFYENFDQKFPDLSRFKSNFLLAPNFTNLFVTWILWNRTRSFICAMIRSWGRLRSGSFGQITKKIWQNRKFLDEKWFFWFFKNCF